MANANVSHPIDECKAAQLELQIIITPLYRSIYKGTREQLIEEGLIPDGFKWPIRSSVASFTIGAMFTEVSRCQPSGRGRAWVNGDYWKVTRRQKGMTYSEAEALHNFEVARKALSLEQDTPTLTTMVNRRYRAGQDVSFTGYMRAIVEKAKGSKGTQA